MLHRFRLGSGQSHSVSASWEVDPNFGPSQLMAITGQYLPSTQSSQSPWQASAHILHLPPHLPFPAEHSDLPSLFQIAMGKTTHSPTPGCRPILDSFSVAFPPKLNAHGCTPGGRSTVVRWCQHFLWNWCHDHRWLGSLEMVTRFPYWPKMHIWHWLGGGSGGRARPTPIQHPDQSYHVFLVHSNSLGVVTVTNKGCSHSRETNQLKHIYSLQAHHYIHVLSCDNIVNALSRGDIAGILHGFPSAHSHISILLPTHLSDKLSLC